MSPLVELERAVGSLPDLILPISSVEGKPKKQTHAMEKS